MAQKDANLIDESQVKNASKKRFLRFYGEDSLLEQAATEQDLNALSGSPDGLSIFGVSREHPLDGKFILPQTVATGDTSSINCLDLQAQPGEYLVFQIVLWSKEKTFILKKASCGMEHDFTCFNLEGVSFKGETFHKELTVLPQKTAVLWCGLQIAENAAGTLQENIILSFDSCERTVALTVKIAGENLSDSGENDDFRMSRLRWLNSGIGQEEFPPAPYQPLRREGNVIFLKGHSITLGDDGLPSKICSGYTKSNTEIAALEKDLFSQKPELFTGEKILSGGILNFYEENAAALKWSVKNASAELFGELNFNGTLKYHLVTKNPDGIRLKFSFADAPFMLGLGVKRPCVPPEEMEWHWNPERWEDSFWVGNVNSGCIIRLTSGKEQEVPLLNCYYNWSPLQPPESWHNNGKGGIKLRKTGKGLEAICFSGEDCNCCDFHFELRLTPFHPVDREQHWNARFFHPHMHSFELKDDDCFTRPDFETLRKKGVKYINVHHAISLNPIINYPFSEKSLHLLQKFVEKAHREGFKVLLYYTVRELTVHAPEFKAMYALDGEIFFPWQDNGKWPVTTPAEGPDPWFKDHLDHGFIPAWTEVIKSGPLHGIPDRSLITVPRSRLENFFLEGLRFLLERCPIDGLYLDDCDLSERGMARLKRVFRKYRGADPILDFHAWESFNSAYCVPLRDMERFPFLTRLWLGEGVRYDQESYENWLIRLSGLPFGLTGEMLGTGNPYLGLLFGMTNRYGWGGNPCELWKIFDQFGIKDAEMGLDIFSDGSFGTDSQDVHVTLWKKPDGSVMAAVGSWSENTETVHLKLPVELRNRRLIQPEIIDFQESAEYQTDEPITIEPKKGVLLFLK